MVGKADLWFIVHEAIIGKEILQGVVTVPQHWGRHLQAHLCTACPDTSAAVQTCCCEHLIMGHAASRRSEGEGSAQQETANKSMSTSKAET